MISTPTVSPQTLTAKLFPEQRTPEQTHGHQAADGIAVLAARHLPNLDLLRSIAVTLVVVDHAACAAGHKQLGPFDAGWIGRSGVFLFFVHTCMVLMQSLERRPRTLDFYIRRVFRIYPLVFVAVFLVVVTRAPVVSTADAWFVTAPLSPKTVLTNLLLVQNLVGGQEILNVLWSLPVEVQMYVLLPGLWFTIDRQRRLWPLLVVWGLAAAFAFANIPKTLINLANAIPLFLPGAMAFLGFAHWRPRLPAWTFPPALMLALAAFWLEPSVHCGWALSLAVGLALPFFRQIASRWLIVTSQKVAQYSYGIYLSHPFSLVVGFYLLHGRPFALQLGVTLAITAVASIAAYHLVEKPLIDVGGRVARRWASV